MKDNWSFVLGLVALSFICGTLIEQHHVLRGEEKLPCCEPAPADPRIDSLLLRADVIRKGHEDADAKLDAIAVGVADLVSRRPVVVEKVVTVEKEVDRIVEKPVAVVTERVVYRADSASIEAMREARRYIAQWTFVDDPTENAIRAGALKKLAKALGDAK